MDAVYIYITFLFQNSFQSKSFFVVHPEWLSEHVDNTDSEPLNRPPWPWEQPRYRQNIQIPITYDAYNKDGDEKETEVNEGDKRSPPPLPYALPRDYTFAHPGIDETRPDEKTTCFGAPVVDTSIFKLGY